MANHLAKGERLLPVDEGAQNQSFSDFRVELLEAVKAKDADFLLEITHPKVSFGGRGGSIEEFKQYWRIDSANSQLWKELETILKLGSTFRPKKHESEPNGKTFVVPYLLESFPAERLRHGNAVVASNEVTLRAKPNVCSEKVATLGYHIVRTDLDQSVMTDRGQTSEMMPFTQRYAWFKVVTTAGQEGYVEAQYIRSPMDYHAFFNNESGKWLMTALVAHS
ncbi:MAG: hypothetical protein AAFW84_04250 [Cyanobacteria bacterium J06635_15]